MGKNSENFWKRLLRNLGKFGVIFLDRFDCFTDFKTYTIFDLSDPDFGAQKRDQNLGNLDQNFGESFLNVFWNLEYRLSLRARI